MAARARSTIMMHYAYAMASTPLSDDFARDIGAELDDAEMGQAQSQSNN